MYLFCLSYHVLIIKHSSSAYCKICYTYTIMAGTSWRAANSLITLRDQLNALYPARSKVSDGLVGDAAHATTISDHNPNSNGVVTAFDITQDPANGLDIQQLANTLVTHNDPRIKYIIANKRLWMSGKWVNYFGVDPHTNHLHLSVSADPNLYDNGNQWNLSNQQEGTVWIEEPVLKDFEIWKAKGMELERERDTFTYPTIERQKAELAEMQANLVKANQRIDAQNIELAKVSEQLSTAVATAQKAAPVATKAPWFVRFLAAFRSK